jgi:hypothetical protein
LQNLSKKRKASVGVVWVSGNHHAVVCDVQGTGQAPTYYVLFHDSSIDDAEQKDQPSHQRVSSSAPHSATEHKGVQLSAAAHYNKRENLARRLNRLRSTATANFSRHPGIFIAMHQKGLSSFDSGFLSQRHGHLETKEPQQLDQGRFDPNSREAWVLNPRSCLRKGV